MFDLLKESFAIYHLPVTTLFGLSMLFWLGVILGGLEIDVFDLDLDSGDLDGDAGGSSLGILAGFMRFVNADSVPTMVVATFMGISMWAIALFSNAFLNPGEPFERSYLIALGLLVPNFIVSALLTKVVTTPLVGFFKKLNYSGEKHLPVIGRSGIVKTLEVTSTFGQVEVESEGAPLLINARVAEGSLPKGTSVLVVDYRSEDDTYAVRSVES